ncbi:MAG: hypothetical protein ACKN9T_05840, partial [Candidatus Methylumidiphilus sp.]
FHATVQWVARNHVGNFIEQNLDWAFLRWRIADNLDLRLGRLGFDAFLLSEYRNVGYAYPWMRPPAEFYSSLFTYHFDGADIAQKFSVGEGYLTLKGYGGRSFDSVLDQNSPSHTEIEAALFGANLVYETGNWRMRVGYAQARPLQNLPLQTLDTLSQPLVRAYWPASQAIVGLLSIEGKALHYSSIGFAYDDGLWPVQAEAAYIDSNIGALPNKATAYLSVGRRFASVTAYALYGVAQSVSGPPAVPPAPAQIPALLAVREGVVQTLNANGQDQQSLSIGARWDVYDNIDLKAQWSHFWLGEDGTVTWLHPSPPLPDEVNVWSFGLDFVY